MIDEPKRKMVSREINTISLYSLEGTFEEAIQELQELSRVFPKAYLTLRHDYEGVACLSIMRDRLETDGELAARLKQEKEYETYQRAQYLRLKEKYENQC